MNFNSQHVPIAMHEQYCQRKCCTARFCPLELAYATTIHKFQGFEAGFDDGDTVKHIIADVSSLTHEKRCPGTAYVATSRARTIGTIIENERYPMNSNIYFDGQVSEGRFKDVRNKIDGEPTKPIKARDLWVKYLMSQAKKTDEQLTDERLSSMRTLVDNYNPPIGERTKDQLSENIMSILSDPSTSWAERKTSHLMVNPNCNEVGQKDQGDQNRPCEI